MAEEKKKKQTNKDYSFDESMNPEVDEHKISLIPKKVVVIPRTVKSRFLLLIASLVVVITIFSVVWLYTDLHFNNLADEVHKLSGEIRLYEGRTASYLRTRDKIDDLYKKANQVGNILDNHIYWTKFFGLLEKHTIPNVYFGDFSASIKDSIHLQATAADLPSLARQLVAFRKANDFAKEVRLSGIRKVPQGVAGAFDIVLAENVFNQ